MGLHRRGVIPLGPEGPYACCMLICGGFRIRTVGTFSLIELGTTQMKAGGTSQTAHKKFLFSVKGFCAQQANILACDQQSIHEATPRELAF